MKKTKVAPAARKPVPTSPWRIVALLSLVVNAALLVWHFRAPAKAKPPVPVVATPSWSPEIAPYAALGSFVAKNSHLAELKWNAAQFAAYLDGFRANYEGRDLPLDAAATILRDETGQRVRAMIEAEHPDLVTAYFRKLRELENIKRTPSGLHYRITEEGVDDPPKAGDTVVISMAVGLPDGSNVPTLGKARMRVLVRELLPGLVEGVQLMKVGGKATFYLPPKLSFVEGSRPLEIPAGVPTMFSVELHDINPAP